MARMSNSGVDDVAESLKDLGLLAEDELISEMLDAGAEVVTEEWKSSIKNTVKINGRSTGDMIKSVGPTKKVKKIGDVSAKTIYPQGKDNKGVRNAEKAFILHYGKSGQPGTHFVDEAESAADDKVTDAMESIKNKYLESKGMV